MPKSTVNKYYVKAALSDDVNSPFIWLPELTNHTREIVKIKNKNNSKTIWCEALAAGSNFIERYNQNPRTVNLNKHEPFAIMNSWYRRELGLDKNAEAELIVITSKYPHFIKQLLASSQHPDNSVRLAALLGFISVFLGIIGLFLGVISLINSTL